MRILDCMSMQPHTIISQWNNVMAEPMSDWMAINQNTMEHSDRLIVNGHDTFLMLMWTNMNHETKNTFAY
jgi:hypothetical protein